MDLYVCLYVTWAGYIETNKENVYINSCNALEIGMDGVEAMGDIFCTV